MIRLRRDPSRCGAALRGASLVVLVLSARSAHADRPFFRAPRANPQTPSTQPVSAPTPAPLPLPAIPDSAPPAAATHKLVLPPPSLDEPQPTPADSSPSLPLPTFEEPVRSLQPQTVERAVGDANVLLSVSEDFVNRLVSRCDKTSGPVQDYVLGAQVTGQQTTDTRVRVEFLPSPTTAKLDVVLGGVSRSRTLSVTPQASLDSSSEQQFDVRKLVEFDGTVFTTRSPGATLESRQRNHHAMTQASRVPVIGSIAETIALAEANRRRPLAEREGARRLTSRVAPELNAAVDEKLAAANQALQAGRQPSSPWSPILNAPLQWMTADHRISAQGQFGSAPPLTAPPPADGLSGASLRVHESAIAEWLNSALPAEREFDVAKLDAWLTQLRDRLGRPRETIESAEAPRFPAPSGTLLVLSGERPLAVKFADQQFAIELTAAIRPPGLPELPRQTVVVSYECRQEPGEVVLRPLDVSVRAGDQAAAGSILSPALQAAIRNQALTRLETLRLPGRLDIPAEDRTVGLAVRSVRLSDGWLAIDGE